MNEKLEERDASRHASERPFSVNEKKNSTTKKLTRDRHQQPCPDRSMRMKHEAKDKALVLLKQKATDSFDQGLH